MRFLTNLQKRTYDVYASSDYEPHGWLLSAHRASAAAVGRARSVRSRAHRLMADNGTIEQIRELEDAFADDAGEVTAAFRSFLRAHRDLGRVPPMSAIPAELRDSATELAERINERVDDVFASLPDGIPTAVQLSMTPTDLVAKEDWSVAVALGLGLERELLGWRVDRYVTRNRQSLRGWAACVADERCADVDLFVTLAAADYPTARAAAREAAAWGAENVALGFAGLNSTPGYTDVTTCPVRRGLRSPGPRRYVRLAEIVAGFRDGYRESSTTLRRFHALGLGARPMWPVVAAGLDWWTELSVDSTAAIHDAEGRAPVAYDPGDLAGRVAIADVATHYVQHGGLPFDSPVFARALLEAPPDVEGARGWLADNDRDHITHDDLRSGRPLAAALEVFANGPGTQLASSTIMHHNYWASDLAAQSIPDRGRRRWALDVLGDLAEGPHVSVTVRNGARAALDVLDP